MQALAPATPAPQSWRYVLWSAVCTLISSYAFYTELLAQTGGEWSAPLDDVFIHFDFARSWAQGFPGQWSVGNGYSSGSTSALYPVILAVGYVLGFRQRFLMVWAAWIACMGVFCTLLQAERALSLWAQFSIRARFAVQALLPVALLMVGGVAWSLWSGMEIALFMALWSGALLAWVRVRRGGSSVAWLSLLCALCVMTRPESVTTAALFALTAAPLTARSSWQKRVSMATMIAGPALVVMLAQAFVNRWLTGETSAYGALVKLAIYSPQMSTAQKIADYTFNLRYAFQRPFEHHLADSAAASSLLVTFAVLSLLVGHHRALARYLAAHLLAWCVLVALNGQVRWQNERYLVPAIVMFLVMAVLGAASLASLAVPKGRALWWTRELGVAALLLFVGVHQVSKWQEQKWFFARAAQNIRDQQTTLGRWLRVAGTVPKAAGLHPSPHRVLLSDAGAIPYASGWKALDIMGLGGYHDLPFARASGHELPAILELVERMPAADRPDVLAIFPSWWPTLPIWFSSGVLKRFPLEHNVICGDFEHVAYKADWSLLVTGEAPLSKPSGTTLLADTLDIADLVSEKAHHYTLASPASGKSVMHVLANPTAPTHDVWDAGRTSDPGKAAHFELRAPSSKPATVVVRLATPSSVTLSLRCNAQPLQTTKVAASDMWVETPWQVTPNQDGTLTCTLSSSDAAHESFHIYLFQ